MLKNNFNLILIIIILITAGCSNNTTSNTTTGNSKITVKLTDAPGDYEHVYIDVADVQVKINNDDDTENGWQSLEAINTGVYDLLELTGGVNVLLADDFQIPSGTLHQIRLVLGDNNTIVIDGDELPLSTPSAQQSGLKIQVNEELLPNFEYTFLLDFNVDESIVIAGNSGNIILKPVLRAIPEITSGTISGTIEPSDVLTEINITIGDEEVSTFTDASGNFLLVGLPEGSYDLSINPDPASGLNEVIIQDVQVIIGENTDIGTVELL